MPFSRTVLLVSPSPQLSRAVAPLVRRAGYDVVLARSFQSARTHLETRPDLVITELKLGEYNGLQLALHASRTPVIVLADESFEHEVEDLGAVWMSPQSASSDELQSVMDHLLKQTQGSLPVPDAPRPRMSRYLH